MVLYSLVVNFATDPANATELITKHSYKPENVIITDWLSGKASTKGNRDSICTSVFWDSCSFIKL